MINLSNYDAGISVNSKLQIGAVLNSHFPTSGLSGHFALLLTKPVFICILQYYLVFTTY